MEPAGSEAFELQPSMWKLITRSCPPEEQEEVQRVLGYAIVEQACELYEEVRTNITSRTEYLVVVSWEQLSTANTRRRVRT